MGMFVKTLLEGSGTLANKNNPNKINAKYKKIEEVKKIKRNRLEKIMTGARNRMANPHWKVAELKPIITLPPAGGCGEYGSVK